MFNCRLVCKLWCTVAESEEFWINAVYKTKYNSLKCWDDFVMEKVCWDDYNKTIVKPHKFYAIMTLRNIDIEKDVGTNLLVHWYKKNDGIYYSNV